MMSFLKVHCMIFILGWGTQHGRWRCWIAWAINAWSQAKQPGSICLQGHLRSVLCLNKADDLFLTRSRDLFSIF